MKPFLLFLLAPFVCLSQSAHFKEIKVKPSPDKYDVDTPTIIYPIIVLTNNAAAAKINQYIKKNIPDQYANDDKPAMNIDSSLRIAANSGLTALSYEAAFNKNGILS